MMAQNEDKERYGLVCIMAVSTVSCDSLMDWTLLLPSMIGIGQLDLWILKGPKKGIVKESVTKGLGKGVLLRDQD